MAVHTVGTTTIAMMRQYLYNDNAHNTDASEILFYIEVFECICNMQFINGTGPVLQTIM